MFKLMGKKIITIFVHKISLSGSMHTISTIIIWARRTKNLRLKMFIFSFIQVLTSVLVAQKNSRIETILLSTHKI